MAPRPMAVHPVHGYAIKPQEDLKTIKRNQRERNRVQTVNSGFDVLKQHLPGTAHLKKVSKVGILQHAMEYIGYLTRVLHAQQHQQPMVFSEFSSMRCLEQQQAMVPGASDADVQLTGYSRLSQPTSDFYSDSDSPMQPSPMHSQVHAMQSPGHHAMHSPLHHAMPSPAPHHMMHSPAHHTMHSVPAMSPYPASSYPAPPALVSSTTNSHDDASSGEEDDILDAIVEWQGHV
jgi:hypothetical protein